MICHQVTLSGDAEWPKVAYTVIEAYYCACCERAFSETNHTALAHLKTPIALVVQVLAALTEGVGINAATRLYGVSKNSIYRWQERLSGLKKRCCCLR